MFDPKNFVSRFQLVFIVIQRVPAVSTSDGRDGYHVAIVRDNDVQAFRPLPGNQVFFFDADAVANGIFRQYVLTAAINAENSCYASGKLRKLFGRTRRALLDSIIDTYTTTTMVVPPEMAKGNALMKLSSIFSSRKRPTRFDLDISTFGRGASVRWVKVKNADGEYDDVGLVLSHQIVAVFDTSNEATLHHLPLGSLTAWYTSETMRFHRTIVFGKADETLQIACHNGSECLAIEATISALPGCEQWTELVLVRDGGERHWGLVVSGRRVQMTLMGTPASRLMVPEKSVVHFVDGRSTKDFSDATFAALMMSPAAESLVLVVGPDADQAVGGGHAAPTDSGLVTLARPLLRLDIDVDVDVNVDVDVDSAGVGTCVGDRSGSDSMGSEVDTAVDLSVADVDAETLVGSETSTLVASSRPVTKFLDDGIEGMSPDDIADSGLATDVVDAMAARLRIDISKKGSDSFA
jgi:hypothetical protein